MTDDIVDDLRAAYDRMVDERDASATQPWKAVLRQRFLDQVLTEGGSSLLEVGAGTGVHGRFFSDGGLDVLATDLSSAMVESCRAKGLNARQMNLLMFDIDGSFDAVFALNCLLHVPPEQLVDVLRSIHAVLHPGGLLCWVQYGGVQHQGPMSNDHYCPKRYFSMLDDAAFLRAGKAVFELVAFETIALGDWHQHVQAAVFRRGVNRAVRAPVSR